MHFFRYGKDIYLFERCVSYLLELRISQFHFYPTVLNSLLNDELH
jgi:hypothetical protein